MKNTIVTPEPEEMRIISFAGVHHADIVYHMAKLASLRSDQVLCIDNSERQDLIKSIHKAQDAESAEIGNITYLGNRAWSEAAYSTYSTTIIYHGMEIDSELWEHSTTRFFMIDTDRFHLLDARESLKEHQDKPLTLLAVDAYFEKIKEKDLPELLSIPEEIVEDIVTLPFEPDDIAALQSFQFNGIQRLKDTSGSMQDFMMILYCTIFGAMKKRDFRKLAAKAR
jgi:hypothetical protein